MNRRGTGGEQVLLVWLIFLIVLVLGGLVLGSSIFYGRGYDYRQAEADTLSYSVARCLAAQPLLPNTLAELTTLCRYSFSNTSLGMAFSLCPGSCATREPVLQVGPSLTDCFLKGKNERNGKCSHATLVRPEGSFEIVTMSSYRTTGGRN